MSAGRVLTVLFALIAVSNTVPHERIPFHKHTEDFLGLILAESGLQLERLLKQYGENKDIGFTLTYLRSTDFKDLFYEIENLPEFKAVLDYLENARINARHILDKVNELIDENESIVLKHANHKKGEMPLNSFLRDSLDLFPKDKLAALFEEKKADYPTFRYSVEKLQTNEWERKLEALWENQKYKQSVHTLAENGLDVRLLIMHIKAIFGQN